MFTVFIFLPLAVLIGYYYVAAGMAENTPDLHTPGGRESLYRGTLDLPWESEKRASA